MGKVGYAGKINHEWEAEQVSYMRRKIDRVVINAALRPLHPIDNTSSV